MTKIGTQSHKISDSEGQALSLRYPFNWEGLEDFAYPPDDNGVPQVDLGPPWGLQHNPITVAQYGLYHLQKAAGQAQPGVPGIVRSQIDWLVQNFKDWKQGIGAWIYEYDLSFYGPTAPWISGMAQAQGISFLLRAHSLVSDERFLNISQKAFKAFLHPVSEGGVVSHFPDGSPVFEEYPTDPPSLVLNGHMFALLGLHDYAVFWHDKVSRELFQIAVTGLKKNLARYDTGYWNLYDLHPTRRLASPMYIKVHVQLLEILSGLSGDDFFAQVAARWRRYLRSPLCRLRWFVRKSFEKTHLRDS